MFFNHIDKSNGHPTCCNSKIGVHLTPSDLSAGCSPSGPTTGISPHETNEGDKSACSDGVRCDEKCIISAAALECSITCSDEQYTLPSGASATGEIEGPRQRKHQGHIQAREAGMNAHVHAHGENGQHLDEPCQSHLKYAMEKYQKYLQSAQCICRNFLSTIVRLDKSGSQPTSNVTDSISTLKEYRSNLADYHKRLPCYTGRSATDSTVTKSRLGCCDSKEDCSNSVAAHDQTYQPQTADVEKAAEVIHVKLNVLGMDCSGCANNLTKALETVSGTRNVQVTFITSVAEFDLDTRVTTLKKAVWSAQRATRYRLMPFSSDTQTIDVVMTPIAAQRLMESLPDGVERCEKLSKTVYEVIYDPYVIGPRDLLHRIGAEMGPPRVDSSLDEGRCRLLRISGLTTTAFVFTIPVLILAWGNLPNISYRAVLIVQLALATVVQGIAVLEFYCPAITSLIYNRVIEMEMLVVISITAAYAYSVIALGLVFAGKNVENKPCFETSTLLISLILLGRLLAAWGRKRAVEAVSMTSLQASTALLVDQLSGTVDEIDARLLQYGDVISILPHSRIVTDADVVEGTSDVDESMLTGESLPVLKTVGSSVVSGTTNRDGKLTARVTRLPGKNTITDIANLVEQAQSSKPRVQDLADRVAGYFVPVVCTAALFVFIIWFVVKAKIQGRTTGIAAGAAMSYCIAVLAISCPCALGLAVPLVLVIAAGKAARGGVIIKTADVIEHAFRVTDVVFDKTGTLTESRLEVAQEAVFPTKLVDRETLYSLLLTLVESNKHPISQSITKLLEHRMVSGFEVKKLTSVPGCGVEATWGDMKIRAGCPKWLQVEHLPAVREHRASGLSLLCVTIQGELVAIFGLKSILRERAAAVVRKLQRRKIAVHILSGDGFQAVQHIASDLGIVPENVAAERTPAQKQEYIRKLMDSGKITLFCGDGTNDAIAVAQANIGVQIESSSDVTRATADVVLLQNLDGIVDLLDVSKAAYRRILFNFAWSAIYNILAILLAAGAFVKIRIPPAYAGLGEIVSVMPVIIAASTQPKVKTRAKSRK